jgi:signal transduction histidine kinase
MGRHIIPNTRSDEPQVARSIDSVQESLQIIINEGERLTNLINDVLDLAKIEAGKVVWDDRPLQISGIIEQALAATTSLFKDKGLRLNNQVESDLPIVVGDHDKLIQVMINLLSNAVKFTDEGMITCTGQRTNGEVVVSVSDTGIGIEEADLPKVFEVFRQVGDTLTDKPKGTGLGLAICKEIIEHHGGRIWAESQPGHGSTFSFSLPIIEEETMELVGVDYPNRNPAALN